jgi:DNA-binding transcriptional ArsR family regulator
MAAELDMSDRALRYHLEELEQVRLIDLVQSGSRSRDAVYQLLRRTVKSEAHLPGSAP